MKIAVVGTGYVGLVTGTCFAETGNDVICVDIDKDKVAKMKKGVVPIYEPHLDVLFERNLREGRLHFTTDLGKAVAGAEVIFFALPTPPAEDGSADLSYVLGVAKDIGPLLCDYAIIVNKSTVPVGTAEKVRQEIAKGAKVSFDVVSNPEFLREGFAVDDFMKPDRVVVGSLSKRANKVMKELYAPFLRQGNPIFFMDERSAELTKYAANTFLAAKISFMNEIANLCELLGADVDAVRVGIGADERIGKRFLFAGIGYGGSCFPKDVQALERIARESKYDFKILSSVMDVNHKQRLLLADKVRAFFQDDIKGKKFAIWGLAFKPDTDDIREAPAGYIIKELLDGGASISAYDPEAIPNTKKVWGDKISYASDQYEALEGADAMLVVTEWSEFRSPDFEKMAKKLKRKIIFDGRNIYDLPQMKRLGFFYSSVGRPTVNIDAEV